MVSEQHKYILLAFKQSVIPKVIRHHVPELMLIDATISGYCTQLLNGAEYISLVAKGPIIDNNEKKAFSTLINMAEGTEKEELIIYYRLLVLTEEILLHHQLE